MIVLQAHLLLSLVAICASVDKEAVKSVVMACRVKQKATAHQQREGGGFIVRRPIGGEISEVDPFLMLDHLGPATYGPGEAVGAPDHPHRGFETVTYILQGGVHHQDSMGNEGNLTAGWCQWMTAGAGIVHSEMPTAELLEHGGTMEGFQLWVNLPARDKMTRPRYQDTPPDKMPIIESTDKKVWIRLIAGKCQDKQAYIETRTKIKYLDIRLQPHATWTEELDETMDGLVYVYRGKGTVTEALTAVGMGQVVTLTKGTSVKLATEDEEMRMLLIAGEPIGEPIVKYGPFVMNTQAEVRQAMHDYQAGMLGYIGGAAERFAATEAAVAKQQQRDGAEL
eukprot:TRINITY_DN11748_c0_g2_i9.p2 TRINITY_DN11748_c0_g2~~TRINITY_DN11748_c0_g2_i9.p2  ORF type:complete len:338 (+),score=66.46 TRINITY_DN11748_c0_g2_i9:1244-2257(+)